VRELPSGALGVHVSKSQNCTRLALLILFTESSDVEILLDGTARVGKEGPVGADSAAVFIRLTDIVGAYRDKPAVANLELAMELNKPFSLPAILGAETSAAEDENHGMLSLQVGELPVFRGVVGKLIVGEDSPWNNFSSQAEPSLLESASPF
jgi:hypothetical protein